MARDHDPRDTTVRSIRESGATPRDPRQPLPTAPPASPQRLTAPAGATPRSRPNANPVRLMIGFAGLASAAAFTTAMLPSVTPSPAAAQAQEPAAPVAVDPTAAPPVQHVTRYVQLQPGQTAPPQSTVVVKPTPTPKVTVKVVTQTKQSGKP